MRSVLNCICTDNQVTLTDSNCIRQNVNRSIFLGHNNRFLLRCIFGIVLSLHVIRSDFLTDCSKILRSVRTLAVCVLVCIGYCCRSCGGHSANRTCILTVSGHVAVAPFKAIKIPLMRSISEFDRLLFKDIDIGRTGGSCKCGPIVNHIIGC